MAIFRIPGFTNYKEHKEGGSSIILRANRQRDNKLFALKIIKEDVAKDKENLRSFAQEAEMLREIKCRSIVRVFDYIEDAKPNPCMIMEWIEGNNLKVLIKTNIDFVHQHWHSILYEIAGALMYTHKRGIIHRDIKPENIIVDKSGMAKLIDFSLALSKTKKPRKIQGTPSYISPEQIEKNKITTATDIYSFGVTAYEMMAGFAPFSEPNILEKHLRAIPESLAKVAAYVNKDLAAFIMRMLQKDPKSRPQDMTELLTLLKQIDSAPITSEIKDVSRRKKQIQLDEIEEEPQEKLSSSQESEQLLIATRKKNLGVEDKKPSAPAGLFTPISDEEYKQQLAAFSDNYQELRGKFDFEQDTKTDLE